MPGAPRAEPLRTSLARGAVAGLVGAAAMTVATHAEARWLGRPRSQRGARVATALLGVPMPAKALPAVDQVVHWGYGALLGAGRAATVAMGASPAVATVGHFVVAWGPWRVAVKRAELERVRPSGLREVAVDGANHAVYSLATTLALRMSSRRTAGGRVPR